MSRVRSASTRHKRRKKVLQQAKGFRGGRSKLYCTARESVMRSMAASYRGRKLRKRDFRSLWITRIRAGVVQESVSYSRFIEALKKANVVINRKILAELAVRHPTVFSQIVQDVKKTSS